MPFLSVKRTSLLQGLAKHIWLQGRGAICSFGKLLVFFEWHHVVQTLDKDTHLLLCRLDDIRTAGTFAGGYWRHELVC